MLVPARGMIPGRRKPPKDTGNGRAGKVYIALKDPHTSSAGHVRSALDETRRSDLSPRTIERGPS